MPCPRKRVCACFAAQKLILQFLHCTPTKTALLTLAVPKTRQHFLEHFLIFHDKLLSGSTYRPLHLCLSVDRGWARVGPTKTQWNNLVIKLFQVPLHDWVYMQAILLFTWLQNAYVPRWCLGTLPQWSKGSLMFMCCSATGNCSNCCKTPWKWCSTITLITCCNITAPIRLIYISMQLRLTLIKTFMAS